ncbi:hypothetical protein LguiA_018290 [Lonicera macranthoides]
MDREQEDLQFLGVFGIYKESCKIIAKCKRIFSQITLALIIPLSFIFLAHMEFSDLLFQRMSHTDFIEEQTYPTGSYNRYSKNVTAERLYYWLFKLAYYIVILILSLLSTSAVVYTIACVYTAREITFKKIMSVVPKVWKRLMVTFLCSFLAFFIYHIVLVLTVLLAVVTLGYTNAFLPILIIILIFYAAGFVYMTIVWQLASVVSVMEKTYGFKAVVKSKNLIKGKLWAAIAIFVKLNILFVVIEVVFATWVVYGGSVDTWKKLLIGPACWVVLLMLVLFGLVVQTIIYFVCKSYHHENIDKSALSNHLEVIYLGEYVPLNEERNVQLEQSHV